MRKVKLLVTLTAWIANKQILAGSMCIYCHVRKSVQHPSTGNTWFPVRATDYAKQ